MKIHRITVTNLGSLYGRHEIDLDRDLDNAPLFLINGPTGSGKSTLMDAIALALFGVTPRLNDSAATVQDELGDTNARQIMSRGRGESVAEVVFSRLGADGRRFFRASWTAKRAHKKHDGAFQSTLRALTELDATFSPIASPLNCDTSKIAAYKPCFEEALQKLTVVDFTRSILLAQGEFSAFLRTNEEGRSKILERVADVEIYRKIGERAHARWQEARQDLDKQQAAGDQIELPDEDELERLRGQAADYQGAASALEGALAKLSAIEHGLAKLLQLDVADRQDRDSIASLDNEATSRAAAIEAAADGERACATELKRAEDAESELRPLLVRAREAHAELRVARQAAEGAARAFDEAMRSRQELLDRQREKTEACAAAETSLALRNDEAEPARRWSEATDRVADLERDCAALRELMRQRSEAVSNLDSQRGLYRTTTEKLAGRRSQLSELVEASAPLEERLRQADEALKTHAARWGGIERAADTLRNQRAAARALLDRFAQLAPLEQSHNRLVEKHGGTEAALRREREALEGLEVRLRAGRESEERSGELVEARQVAANIARAATTLLEHRSQLQPGEKCPVCGSTEHPDAHLGDGDLLAQCAQAELDLAQAKKHLESLRRDRETLQAQVAAATQAVEMRQADLVGVTAELSTVATNLESGREALALALSQAEYPGDTDLESLQSIDSELALGESRLATLQRELSALAAENVRAANDRAALEASVAELSQQLETIHNAGLELRTRAENLQKEITARTNGLTALIEQLPAPMHRHEARFDSSLDIEAIESWLRRELKAAGERLVALERAEALAVAARAAKATVDSAFTEHTGVLEKREAERSQTAERLKAAAAACSALFDGADPNDVEHKARQVVEEARRTLDAAKAAVAALAAQLTTVQSQIATRRALLAERATERDALETTLRSALAGAGLEDATAVASPEIAKWLADSLDERRKQLADLHHQAGSVTAKLQAASAALERYREVQAEITRLRENERFWDEMNKLIGTKGGARFAQFAQALTLERLLEGANLHLRQLAPRYAFVVRRGSDNFPTLFFDVRDHDQAGVLRPLSTLSGGETFLCSLALALGLSDLHRHRRPIETLLLDEGFGTLDPDTLDTAISALEQLHASGARVGIISHVAELKQRIPARITIEKRGGGRSEIVLPGGRLASDPR